MTSERDILADPREIQRPYTVNFTFRQKGDSYLINDDLAVRFDSARGRQIRVWVACERKVPVIFPNHDPRSVLSQFTPMEGVGHVGVLFNPEWKRNAFVGHKYKISCLFWGPGKTVFQISSTQPITITPSDKKTELKDLLGKGVLGRTN